MFIRGVAILVLSIAFTCGAFADSPRSEKWFVGHETEVRTQIQTDLLLLGHYDVFVDGKFGPGTYRALTAYEERFGLDVDGVLQSAEIATLHQRATEVSERFGIDLVIDDRGQSALLLPKILLSKTNDTKRGRSYANLDNSIVLETIHKPFSEESFEDLFSNLSTSTNGRDITYSRFNNERFVVSGYWGGLSFYMLAWNTEDATVGFSVTWDQLRGKDGSIAALFVASNFVPLKYLPDGAFEDGGTPVPAPVPPKTAAETENEVVLDRMGAFAVAEGSEDIIVLSGPIEINSPLEFLRALKARPNAKTLLLNSDGGLVAPALVIAHEVRERGLATFIVKGSGCYSACAYIFFAGVQRIAEGELGVHQVWNQTNDLKSGQATLSDVLEALTEFGVDQGVVSVMLRTLPEDMYVFSAREIAAMHINAGDPLSEAARSPQTDTTSDIPHSLLLEASEDGKTGAAPFSGSVTWQRGTDDQGNPTLVGRANIPTRQLSVVLQVRKNSDLSMPASHLIDVSFTVGPEFAGGSIAGMPGLLLKNEELVQGTPLVGASARTAANSFLFALSSDPEDVLANDRLIASSGWLDIAIIYATGRRAIITLEKGAEGQDIVRDVLSEWRSDGQPERTAYMQISTASSEDEARDRLRSAEFLWGSLWGDLSAEIERAETGGGKYYYRVRVPVPTEAEANRICAEIVRRGGDCFVTVG